MRLQEALCRAREFFALRRTDGSCAAAETHVAPVAYFREYQCRAVAHDQVELSEAGAVVAFDQFQAGAFHVLEGELLEARADRARLHGWMGGAASAGCVSSPAATGRATPPWNCTQIGVRCTWPNASIVSCPVAPAR